MAKISVAMATFNGALYVREQLESLAAQTHLPREVVVCDDGSSDATTSILESFALSAPFPVRIYRNKKNLGYSDNFLNAAKLCEGDWVAFCDQDDVWLPSKLKSAADEIARRTDLTLILQNAELCDEGLNRRGRVFPNKIVPGNYGPSSQYGFWVWPGFLKTVRSEIVHMDAGLDRPPNYFYTPSVQTHDKWTCMIANALGGISVLGEPSALYRRHEAALTGSYAGKSVGERVNESRAVAGDHYRFLAGVARSSCNYLIQLAAEIADDRRQSLLKQSADWFQCVAGIQDYRADLYEAEGLVHRAAKYLRIWRNGGYLGPPFVAMGGRSALKDAVRVLFGSKITALKPS